MTPLTLTAASLSQMWMMEEQAFWHAKHLLDGMDFHVHLQEYRESKNVESEIEASSDDVVGMRSRLGYDVKDGVAIIPIAGVMMKKPTSFDDGVSTVRLRRAVRAAANEDDVHSIVFHVDSPGGEAAGTHELHQDIKAACGKKRVYAYIQDLGASAAYYAICGADKIFVNSPGLPGSIGTLLVVHDLSKLAEDKGIKVYKITQQGGETYKGAAAPGTKVTKEQLAYFQGIVDNCFAHFANAVGEGRKLNAKQLLAVADGRLFSSEDAKAKGLVDEIATLDECLEQVVSNARNRTVVAVTNNYPALLTCGVVPPAQTGMKENHMSLWDQMKARLTGESEPDDGSIVAGTSPSAPTATLTVSGSGMPLQLHPVVKAASDAGITTAEQFADLKARAEAGDALLAELRNEAKAEANRAFGGDSEEAKSACIAIDGIANIGVLKSMRNSYRDMADSQFGTTEQDGSRQTAPANDTYSAPVEASGPVQKRTKLLEASPLGRAVLAEEKNGGR